MPHDESTMAGAVPATSAERPVTADRPAPADRPVTADAAALADELERRLRDQVSLNSLLDAELRYLQSELQIRAEYIRGLEGELEGMGSVIGHQQSDVAEYAAYRNRVSHRTVDRAIARIERSPVLYRLARRTALVVSGWRRPTGAP